MHQGKIEGISGYASRGRFAAAHRDEADVEHIGLRNPGAVQALGLQAQAAWPQERLPFCCHSTLPCCAPVCCVPSCTAWPWHLAECILPYATSCHGVFYLELEEGAALLIVHGPQGAEADLVLQKRSVNDQCHLLHRASTVRIIGFVRIIEKMYAVPCSSLGNFVEDIEALPNNFSN